LKIGIIGKGNVGTALAVGLSRGGHEIKHGHRDPREPVAEAAEWGEVIILAVPYSSVPDAAKAIGSAADGKTLIDVTNALGPDMQLAVGFTTSSAEELQKILPKAYVVKAFNTVFAQNQSTAKVDSEQLTLFIAGDDPKAKQTVMQLGKDIGFDPIDAGSLQVARYLEPMGMLMINLGYNLGMGANIGLKLVRG
jgi:predicted dinucleotide-binding enzyme